MRPGITGQGLQKRSRDEPRTVLVASDLVVARRRSRATGAPARTWVGGTPRTPKPTFWDRFDMMFVFALGGLVFLNITDLGVTLFEVGRNGWDAEGNLVMRAVGLHGGTFAFAMMKVIALALTVPIMWHIYRLGIQGLAQARAHHEIHPAQRAKLTMLSTTLGLTVFYLWVIQNNIRVVALIAGASRSFLGF